MPPPPRTLSPWRTRWLLNLFPPLFLSGIRVVSMSPDFRSCRVRVRRSLLTRNLEGTTFGGTIFSATDPFYAILYWQALAHRGVHAQAWLRSARIRYRRPAATRLELCFELAEDDIEDARRALERDGRFVRTHRIEAIDVAGVVCAEAESEVYLRTPRAGQRETTGF